MPWIIEGAFLFAYVLFGVRSYWEICLVGKGRFLEGGAKGVGVLGVVGSLSEGGSRVGFQSKCTVDRYMAQLSNGVFIN